MTRLERQTIKTGDTLVVKHDGEQDRNNKPVKAGASVTVVATECPKVCIINSSLMPHKDGLDIMLYCQTEEGVGVNLNYANVKKAK